MKKSLLDIKEKLKKYKQEHLLLKYDELNELDKERLLNQIKNIDFDLINGLYNSVNKNNQPDEVEISPVNYIDKSKMSKKELEKYTRYGIKSIKNREYAVVTMAGGQGTRLGYDGAKGTFVFDEGKSLFEILCDSLKEIAYTLGVYIKWYIMTSPENNEDTINFFKENNYFGYPSNFVCFFVQGQLPMVGEDGKILLTKEGFIKEGSNGHGGTLSSLNKSGLLEEMELDGVKYVFISGVDNVLANLCDPLLLGLAISTNSDIMVKSVEKINPNEKAGVFCKKNDKTGVVEYSEISDKMANLRDEYGNLVYGDLNALLHIFTIDILKKICEEKLPYHIAYKKADYLNEHNKFIEAKKPNAYKFETFIFDSFEMTDKVNVLRVKREEEFAPIKNAKGEDSPETAKMLFKKSVLLKTAQKEYKKWMSESIIDEKTKEELSLIENNNREIIDRFYKKLEFGTAGLRGIVGAGTNRMNKYTVSAATQGIANYLNKLKGNNKKVVIGYDTRLDSKTFAKITAKCFIANGIKVYLFNECIPVPVLSFATRELEASIGIMITASHNPQEYNGYKVLMGNGSQIIGKVADSIIDEVDKVNNYSEIKMISNETMSNSRKFVYLGKELINRFIKNNKDFELHNNIKNKNDLKIVYSPVHGTGYKVLPKAMKELGYENIWIVPEQEMPNGNFPTVSSPNPENPETNELAINLAKKVLADIVITTDPDTDRIGVNVWDTKKEDYVFLSGNQVGILMTEYIISSLKELKKMPENPCIISTIVSSNLPKIIAEKNGVEYIETYTGFKNLAKYINEFIKTKEKNVIFSYEESFGYLYGTNARDKDAVSAALLILEIAAYYKQKNRTLCDVLFEIYEKYGYSLEKTTTLTLTGEEGAKKIAGIMEQCRKYSNEYLKSLGIISYKDFLTSLKTNLFTGKTEKINFEKSNVLLYELENNSWFAIRPSGTEPKLKFYYGIHEKNKKAALAKAKIIEGLIESFKRSNENTERKVKYNPKTIIGVSNLKKEK